jgi:hypothetical protein
VRPVPIPAQQLQPQRLFFYKWWSGTALTRQRCERLIQKRLQSKWGCSSLWLTNCHSINAPAHSTRRMPCLRPSVLPTSLEIIARSKSLLSLSPSFKKNHHFLNSNTRLEIFKSSAPCPQPAFFSIGIAMDPATIVSLTTLLFMVYTNGWEQFQKYKKKKKNKLRDKTQAANLDEILSTSGQIIKSNYDKGFRKFGLAFANGDCKSIYPSSSCKSNR